MLHFLDAQEINAVIAINEFQQILNYPETNIEVLLRSSAQLLKNVDFIFSGSNHAMMLEIFNSAKRSFNASTKSLHLQKIDSGEYFPFIGNHFERDGFCIDDSCIDLILELTCSHTYYTQYLCNQLFAGNKKNIGIEAVTGVWNKILHQNEGIYFQYRNLLTTAQWKLLKAIAKEQKLGQPYSKNFIHKYNFGTSAIVKRGIDSLIQKEMVYYNAAFEVPY